MAENLAFQLRRGNRLTGCVTVKIRYSDFQTQTLQKKIPYTAADHELIPMVLDLFKKTFNRRLLVRLIGVRYSSLVSGNHRLGLFGDEVDYPALYKAMDQIRIRYGDRAVIKAIGLQAKTIGGWNPFQWRARLTSQQKILSELPMKLHSCYSLKYGILSPEELVEWGLKLLTA